MDKSKLLIVDDDPDMRLQISRWLSADGYKIQQCGNGQSALDEIGRSNIGIVLLDLQLPDMSGHEVLEQIRSEYPDCCTIIITAYGNSDIIEKALQQGATDFINKPIDFSTLALRIRNAYQSFRQKREAAYQIEEERERSSFSNIIWKSRQMSEVIERVQKVAVADTNVLILGESGTGKELIARAIHYHSPRSENVLVVADCSAMSETIIESDLFGHERGAFTGAMQRRKGKFERADHGTLFIDEIGELSPKVQTKLLRFLQERQFERVGGDQLIPVDSRIVAATNINIKKAVREKRFREDLYFRLSVVTIQLPPLRDRTEEIPLLVTEFIKRHGHKGAKNVTDISQEALDVLLRYDFPGNVRELENIIERAIVLSDGAIIKKDRIFLESEEIYEKTALNAFHHLPLREARAAFEKEYIAALLRKHDGNISQAAQSAGIDRKNFRQKMKQYGLYENDA